MNRNMNGELFSRAELIAMAIEIGAIEAHKITIDMKTHLFHEMTMKHRHALFMRGEAILDTRPGSDKPFVRPTVDMEIVAFLGGKVTR